MILLFKLIPNFSVINIRELPTNVLLKTLAPVRVMR